MDDFAIKDNFDNKSRMHPSTFIAYVKEFCQETWEIRYYVPDIIDGMEKYPKAIPIFNHINKIFPDDEVMIIRLNPADPAQAYYVPITFFTFMGLKNEQTFIDITDPKVLDLESDHIFDFSLKTKETRVLDKYRSLSKRYEIYAGDVIINTTVPEQSDLPPGTIDDKGNITYPEPEDGAVPGRTTPKVEAPRGDIITSSKNLKSEADVEVYVKAGSKITLIVGGSTIIMDGSSINMKSPTINLESPTINLKGGTINATGGSFNCTTSSTNINGSVSVTGSGDVVLNGKSLVNHTHTGNLGVPTSPPL